MTPPQWPDGAQQPTAEPQPVRGLDLGPAAEHLAAEIPQAARRRVGYRWGDPVRCRRQRLPAAPSGGAR